VNIFRLKTTHLFLCYALVLNIFQLNFNQLNRQNLLWDDLILTICDTLNHIVSELLVLGNQVIASIVSSHYVL
jgi:hypothetical protein